MPRVISMNEHNYLNEMIWVPGRGPDEERLRFLARRFKEPAIPSDEEWGIDGPPSNFEFLRSRNVNSLSQTELLDCFERLVLDPEYIPEVYRAHWYAYFTADILARERYIGRTGQHLISLMQVGLISLDLLGEQSHPGVGLADFAAALGQIPMHPAFWDGSRYRPLADWDGYRCQPLPHPWGGVQLDSDLMGAFFLVWRYLRPEAIDSWLRAVLAIEDAKWRAHFILCIMAFSPLFESRDPHRLLQEYNLQELWQEFESHRPSNGSLDLISPANIESLRASIRGVFDYKVYSSWIEQFSDGLDSESEMELWMDQFQSLMLG
jgi:hypothetical protein